MTTPEENGNAATQDFANRLAALLNHSAEPALKSNVPEKAIGKDGKLKWENLDTSVERSGTKIVLPDDPAPMPIKEAIKALERKEKDENTLVNVHEVIDAFPLDGAVAFVKAIRIKYGWANSVPTPGFFGPKPPRFITVDTGPDPDDKIQIPWGGFQIPGIENPIHTDSTEGRSGPVLVIYGEVRKKEVWILKELAALTREIVTKDSIYRGKAIRLVNAGSELDLDNPPIFVQTDHVNEDELVLPADVADQVATNIWTLIEKTAKVTKQKIPLKRGVLLEGKYGTGKTLVALNTAKKCVANGWTYITIDRVQGLAAALEFAKRYEPAVIFAEDIDRATAERNEPANDLLNILDGVVSKNAKIMVVLTTNHVERINQGMLRPGRLDAVISVRAPDAEGAERLLRLYGRGLIDGKENLAAVSKELAGQIPATIREVVERSKLSAIRNDRKSVKEADLLVASASMRHHLSLLNRSTSRVLSLEERVGTAIGDLLNDRVADAVAKGTAVTLLGVSTVNGNKAARPEVHSDQTVSDLTDKVVKRIKAPEVVTEITKVANGHDA